MVRLELLNVFDDSQNDSTYSTIQDDLQDIEVNGMLCFYLMEIYSLEPKKKCIRSTKDFASTFMYSYIYIDFLEPNATEQPITFTQVYFVFDILYVP
jgi:hypothetical protein